MIYPRVAARLFNTPLMVHPGKAAAILAGLGGRVTGGQVDFAGAFPLEHRAGTVGDRLGRAYDRRGQKPYDMVGNVAVIAIEGSLVHKGAFVGSDSGETSYQGIQTQVQAARRDIAVKGVAFEIDSMGGEAAGAFETSDMVAELSREKPTIALLTDAALSGGYLLAAAARQIIIPEHGHAGSIGVVTVHTDMSAAAAAKGLKMTIIQSGAHKADGNPFEPLPEDVAAVIQGEVDAMRQTLARRVATYRGGRISFDQAMATEARVYTGAEAVAAGLADATGHPSEAFKAFVSALNRA